MKGFECQLCQLVSNELKTLMDKNNTEVSFCRGRRRGVGRTSKLRK